MALWTALVIGFFGSFHCVGMCGPIALALPGARQTGWHFVAGRLLYNFGRIVTYTLLGALFGILGRSLFVAGVQKGLSIVLGLIIIASVVLKSSLFSTFKKSTGIDRILEVLKNTIRRQFKRRALTTLFTIGLLNGLLPCGFVYMGLAASLTTGSIPGAAIFMAFFGLGTFPAMMLMAMAPGLISLELRQRISRLIPLLAILLGVYLIYRGMMMGG